MKTKFEKRSKISHFLHKLFQKVGRRDEHSGDKQGHWGGGGSVAAGVFTLTVPGLEPVCARTLQTFSHGGRGRGGTLTGDPGGVFSVNVDFLFNFSAHSLIDRGALH